MQGERSLHHKRPRSKGGDSRDSNISNVSLVKHQAWHTLFDNCEPADIADYINNVWIDPRYKFICTMAKSKENPNQLKLF